MRRFAQVVGAVDSFHVLDDVARHVAAVWPEPFLGCGLTISDRGEIIVPRKPDALAAALGDDDLDAVVAVLVLVAVDAPESLNEPVVALVGLDSVEDVVGQASLEERGAVNLGQRAKVVWLERVKRDRSRHWGYRGRKGTKADSLKRVRMSQEHVSATRFLRGSRRLTRLNPMTMTMMFLRADV